jgi:D-psicose/D-tagatose/L-ribulose 3-epimerase
MLGLESFTGENATIAVAASIWRPLAVSQDELAARSIAHLRALGT